MAETGTMISILKVAKELNVGRETITEFLNQKGFKVDNKPTAKLSDEMYIALLRHFKGDKELKDRADQINLGVERKESISIKDAEPRKSRQKDDEEVLITNVTTGKIVQEAEPEPEKPSKVAREKEKLSGPKVLGKVDLEKKKKKEEPATPEKKEAPVAKASAPIEPKEKPESKEEAKPTPKEEAPEVKKPDPAEEAPEDSREKVRGKVEKLRGTKVLGTVNLDKFAEKSTSKPVATTRDPDQKLKRKRKRLRKDEPKTGETRQAPEITRKEIDEKIKETTLKMQGGKGKQKRAKPSRSELEAKRKEQESGGEEKVLKVTEFVTANELASMLNVPVTQVIQNCMSLGMMVSINQRLDAEVLTIVAEEFGYKVEFVSPEVEDTRDVEEEDSPENLKDRHPIVTIMGHVDHGKTSLLDFIRDANVIAGEAGGITQHIGAYEVTLENKKKITFLDTPGHEAFTAMRARGAKVTDLVVIVIAADDSVMPQTIEAINHAQAAEVPMVFAINKVDKPGANPETIRQQLAERNLLVEEWGGKFQCQEVSAKSGKGVSELLEKILLEAEILELKANPDKRAVGTVIEAKLDKGRGVDTTVLIQAGTLRVGDPVVAGCFNGRVRAMFNERGQKIETAGPSTPVRMLGMGGAPQAGDIIKVMGSEQEARELANKRLQLQREQGMRTRKHITLDEIGRRLAIGSFKELNVIVKGDVDGSVEALSDALLKLSTSEIQINVIHKGVGQISESDVLLASASDAIIIGFQVRPSSSARRLAETEEIDIRLYSIIYDAIDQIKDAMEGLLSPEIKEEVLGTVEVRDVFKISKVGTIAGCMVTDGKIHRDARVRLIRDGVVIYTGDLASLKRFKDDVKEVASGYECGLGIKNFNDIKVGDQIEPFKEVEIARTLSKSK